ncbi:MAG: GntR family transcriptional regulator [Opitutaceae bacterium]|jgi:DNA-binding LacI/PurR family transcriptional regulator|nr:GntR family transcriptional regulator [Opitutaceae bacterium]
MSAITNIERPLAISPETNRRDAAGDQIKHYIRSHRLSPGERLPTVRKMSEHFGITRDAVWRALRQLQKEEWLEVLPNKRYTVSDKLYTRILRSIRVKAVFSGEGYIYFSGFRRLADALSRECRYHNIDLHIQLLPLRTDPDPTVWEGCDLLMMDSDSSGAFLRTFKEFPLPVIGLDANYSTLYHANVVTDHHLGGRIAAEAMLKRGTQSAVVVYHTGSENNPRVSARIDGFRQTWLEGGRSLSSIQLEPIGWSRSSFEIALNVQAYLERHPARGNYFVTDGRLATNFIEVLAYKRVAVPGTVGLIGYDGAQRGELTDPPMTTIQQDMDRIAVSAVKWIRDISSGHEERGVLERISPLMVTRGSF